jgi:hypothetical protein
VFPRASSDRATHENSTYESWKGARGCGEDVGSSQQGKFVYEWGRAEATFDGGKSLVDKYLTVWQNQADCSWKIFRNLVIPDK